MKGTRSRITESNRGMTSCSRLGLSVNSSPQAIAKGNASIAMETPSYWGCWEYGISTKESCGS